MHIQSVTCCTVTQNTQSPYAIECHSHHQNRISSRLNATGSSTGNQHACAAQVDVVYILICRKGYPGARIRVDRTPILVLLTTRALLLPAVLVLLMPGLCVDPVSRVSTAQPAYMAYNTACMTCGALHACSAEEIDIVVHLTNTSKCNHQLHRDCQGFVMCYVIAFQHPPDLHICDTKQSMHNIR